MTNNDIEKFRKELRDLGFPKELIQEFVRIKELGLPEPSLNLYHGHERFYGVLREIFLLELVRRCVGKKVGKRFKAVDNAVRHVRVCLECRVEILNFVEKIKQEFS